RLQQRQSAGLLLVGQSAPAAVEKAAPDCASRAGVLTLLVRGGTRLEDVLLAAAGQHWGQVLVNQRHYLEEFQEHILHPGRYQVQWAAFLRQQGVARFDPSHANAAALARAFVAQYRIRFDPDRNRIAQLRELQQHAAQKGLMVVALVPGLDEYVDEPIGRTVMFLKALTTDAPGPVLALVGLVQEALLSERHAKLLGYRRFSVTP
ncbi:MAG: hypothetical protein HY335_02865, partial [Deinococcus sp.]|nr:hypothetical protein [Deinococcus sp.]